MSMGMRYFKQFGEWVTLFNMKSALQYLRISIEARARAHYTTKDQMGVPWVNLLELDEWQQLYCSCEDPHETNYMCHELKHGNRMGEVMSSNQASAPMTLQILPCALRSTQEFTSLAWSWAFTPCKHLKCIVDLYFNNNLVHIWSRECCMFCVEPVRSNMIATHNNINMSLLEVSCLVALAT